jgi:hypothetical protein
VAPLTGDRILDRTRESLVRDPSVVLSYGSVVFRTEVGRSSAPVRLPGGQLVGRQREREAIDRLLDAAHGGVLVVRGEPGVGKTALLEYAIEAGREFRTARTLGVEVEMELPYAAAQQLCFPILRLKEHLPSPQRDALDVAFGLRGGPTPSPFLVGLAILGLLSGAAVERAQR